MRVEVHIERLVLNGLPPRGADVARMRAALKASLADLLLGLGPEALGRAPSEPTRQVGITLPHDPGPTQVGAGIAGALGAAITGVGAGNPPVPRRCEG
jgi:hypothetical protein